MRRTEARSRDTDRPEGVTDSFHVSLNKVEPAVADRAFNLLTKDADRLALADEVEPDRPEVSIVGAAFAFAGRTEGLAGTGTGPNRSIIGPSSKPESVGPDADAGEKVALGVSGKVIWSDISDAPFIHVTGRDVPGRDQIPQPLSSMRIHLVIVATRHRPDP
jgi:hypothetical protein